MADKLLSALTPIGTPVLADLIPIHDADDTTELKSVTGTQLTTMVGANLSGVAATAIADGTVSDIEFQYINSLTSNAQDQLNLKPETKSALYSEILATAGPLVNNHNNLSSGIKTYNGNQYVAYYNASGQVVLGKRSLDVNGLPSSDWAFNIITTETIADFDDNHQGIGMGIDDAGFIHVAYGMHASALNNFKMPTTESIVGVPVADTMVGGVQETSMTYPLFFNDNNDKLFLSFRHSQGAGNGDSYLYAYDSGTTTWSAAPGTSTNGLMIDGTGSTPSMSVYLSRPYVDSNNVAHFEGPQRDAPGGNNNKDPIYFAYNLTTGAFTQAGGGAQTIPITTANADNHSSVTVDSELSQNNQTRNIYFDGTNVHIFNQYQDANGIQQIFYNKHDGVSWSNTAITKRTGSPSWFNPDTPVFVDSNTGYFYVITWEVDRNSSLTVYESRDSGATWQPPYTIFSSQRSDQWLNIDWDQWDTYNRFNRVFQHTIDDDGNGLATSGTLRHIHIDYWTPSEGKTGTDGLSKDLRSHDDINIISTGGTVSVGQEKAANGAIPMTIHAGDGSGTNFSGLVITKNGGRTLFGNSSGTAGQFAPMTHVLPVGGATIRDAYRLEIPPADDTGTVALKFNDFRQDDDTPIATRPLEEWANAGTTLAQLLANGSFDFKTNPPIGLNFDANGTNNSITNIDVADLNTTGTPDGTLFLRDDFQWTATGDAILASTQSFTGVNTFTNSLPSILIERTTTTDNGRTGVATVKKTGSVNMTDGFGPLFVFAIEDDTSGNVNIAGISAQRDGADTQGKIVFHTNNVLTDRLTIRQDGTIENISIDANGTGNSITNIDVADLNTTGTPDGTLFLRDDFQWTSIPGGGDALVANPLSQFAATTSAQLAGVISDETGSGALVFGTSPTITTPAISGNMTTTGTIDGRDVAADGSKLDGIEALADVTDLANVNAAAATTVGTITTGVWNGTNIAVANGGTGASTAQAAIDTLTAVSGATNEHVLTKDTATGNAIWKAAAGGGGGATDTEFAIPLIMEIPEGTVGYPDMHELATATATVSGMVLPDVTASTINFKTQFPIPDDLASTPGARIEFVIMTKGAVAGPADVRLTVSSLAVADTESFDQAFTAETETTVTMPTTTETQDVYSQDMTSDPVAGDTVLVQLKRDPVDALDDFTNDIQIISATLWIQRST